MDPQTCNDLLVSRDHRQSIILVYFILKIRSIGKHFFGEISDPPVYIRRFISFYPSFYPHFVHKKVEKPSLPGGEELLSAALRLQGPQLLAQTWPSLVALKDEEVVKAGRVDFKVTKSPIEVA